MAKPRVRAMAVMTPSAPPAPSALTGGGSWRAGDRAGEVMQLWLPPLRGADAEIGVDRQTITARARDLARNNGWVAGAISAETDAVVGAEFRPLVKPDWRRLGLDETWAAEWKSAVETLWHSDAEDARYYMDASRQLSIGGLFALAYRSYMLDGDAIGLVQWAPDRPVRTVLRVVDPDLLSNPNDMIDDVHLRGGVEIDANGAAIAYHFRQAHPGDPYAQPDAMRWVRVRRETEWGRPGVIHFFDKHRDGQSRGVSRLAAIVEKLRMEDHYSRVELQAAVINAVLAAFIRSPMDPEAVTDLLSEDDKGWRLYNEERAAYHDAKGGITMAGAKIPHLFPGEDIGTVPSARPAAQFADFEGAVLRHIAAGLQTTYEQLARDWSKTNYSSARAALVEMWRGWTARRAAFAQGFCQPYFMAWLEDKVDLGFLPLPARAPDFRAFWPAYARAKWIGPGRGFVDPVKEVQASALRVALGLSTLEDEAAELAGADLEDNLAQIRREIAMMPEGTLHPMQESFARLLGSGRTREEREEAKEVILS